MYVARRLIVERVTQVTSIHYGYRHPSLLPPTRKLLAQVQLRLGEAASSLSSSGGRDSATDPPCQPARCLAARPAGQSTRLIRVALALTVSTARRRTKLAGNWQRAAGDRVSQTDPVPSRCAPGQSFGSAVGQRTARFIINGSSTSNAFGSHLITCGDAGCVVSRSE